MSPHITYTKFLAALPNWHAAIEGLRLFLVPLSIKVHQIEPCGPVLPGTPAMRNFHKCIISEGSTENSTVVPKTFTRSDRKYFVALVKSIPPDT